jgi:hypothetical protein
MTDEYLDSISKNTARIRDISYLLAEISGGFYIVGNDKLGDELRDMAHELKSAEKDINDAVGREINKNLRRSEESASNTVKAVLARNIL